MVLISSLHCTISIYTVILIRNCLNRRNVTLFFDDPETSHLLMNSNLDPDANFFAANSQLLSNCLYLTSTEFNKIPHFVLIHFPHFILIFVVYLNTLMTYQNFFLHWTGLSPLLLFLKPGYIGLNLIYSICQATILSLVTENIKRVAGLVFIFSLT